MKFKYKTILLIAFLSLIVFPKAIKNKPPNYALFNIHTWIQTKYNPYIFDVLNLTDKVLSDDFARQAAWVDTESISGLIDPMAYTWLSDDGEINGIDYITSRVELYNPDLILIRGSFRRGVIQNNTYDDTIFNYITDKGYFHTEQPYIIDWLTCEPCPNTVHIFTRTKELYESVEHIYLDGFVMETYNNSLPIYKMLEEIYRHG